MKVYLENSWKITKAFMFLQIKNYTSYRMRLLPPLQLRFFENLHTTMGSIRTFLGAYCFRFFVYFTLYSMFVASLSQPNRNWIHHAIKTLKFLLLGTKYFRILKISFCCGIYVKLKWCITIPLVKLLFYFVTNIKRDIQIIHFGNDLNNKELPS